MAQRFFPWIDTLHYELGYTLEEWNETAAEEEGRARRPNECEADAVVALQRQLQQDHARRRGPEAAASILEHSIEPEMSVWLSGTLARRTDESARLRGKLDCQRPPSAAVAPLITAAENPTPVEVRQYT